MRRGDKVKIDPICDSTRGRYGINGEMRQMRETVQMIKSVSGTLVFLEKSSWQWHISDLVLDKDIEKVVIPVSSFDPDNLVVPEVT